MRKILNKLPLINIILLIATPLFITILNYFMNTTKNLNIWYNIILVIGISSLLVGIINLIINIKNKNVNYILLFLIILMLVLACISCYLADNKKIAFLGDGYRNVSLILYLLFVSFFLNAINIPKKQYKLLAILLVITSTIISWISLLNNDFTYKIFYKNMAPYNGIFMHANHMGYYLSLTTIVSIFLFLNEKNIFKKIIYYLMMAVLFITIIANDTFGCYLAVLITLVIITICTLIKKKDLNIIFVVLLFGVFSMMLSVGNGSLVKNNFEKMFFDVNVLKNSTNQKLIEHTGTNRMRLWKKAIIFTKEKPLFGYGINNLPKQYMRYNIREGAPHNFILELSSTNGIPLVIIYLVSLLIIFIKTLRKLNKYNVVLICMFISYLISAFFGNIFFYTSPYFIIVLAFLSKDIVYKKAIGDNNE